MFALPATSVAQWLEHCTSIDHKSVGSIPAVELIDEDDLHDFQLNENSFALCLFTCVVASKDLHFVKTLLQDNVS